MRVLTVGNMYPPHHLGGYELMWRSAVSHLREWGHDVRVLTTGYRRADPEPELGEDDDVHRALGWYWHDHRFPRLGPRQVVALERRNAATFARHVEAFRPDVLSWWAMGGMSLSLIEQGRRAGLPASCAVVDHWLLYGPKVDLFSRAASMAGPARGALERVSRVPAHMELEAAAEWVFASHVLRKRAVEHGWRLSGAEVAYPGIDQGLFAGRRDALAQWEGKLLYCGRIEDRKGIDTTIQALRELPPTATLTVVGAGDDEHLTALRTLAERLGVSGRVAFEQRRRHELPRLYAEADATLFPVRWEEPFGLVPLESMAMGTPVIATGRGGSGEYLADGDNCLLFDAEGGGPALARAVERLAGDAGLRARLRAGGSMTAARFSDESFDRAIERSLSRRRPQAR